LFTTHARRSYLAHAFRRGDVLLFGRETSGVPEKVHAAADARLVIPMREGLRSLNVAMAAAMAVGESMRQTAAPSLTIDTASCGGTRANPNRKNTKRVRDISRPWAPPLTRIARWRSVAPYRLSKSPHKRRRTSHPQHPPRRQGSPKQWQKKA